MKINNTFNIGEELYIRTDSEQVMHILVGIYISPNGLTYCLEDDTEHYDIELSREKDILKTLNTNQSD